MNGEKIIADLELVQMLVDGKGNEGHREIVIVKIGRGRIPFEGARRIGRSDPAPIDIGHETVVILHLQDQSGKAGKIRDFKGNAQVNARVLIIHQTVHIEIDVIIVFRVLVIADASLAGEPLRIIKPSVAPGVSQGIVYWNKDTDPDPFVDEHRANSS